MGILAEGLVSFVSGKAILVSLWPEWMRHSSYAWGAVSSMGYFMFVAFVRHSL